MILTLIAVNDEFIDSAITCLNEFQNYNWDIKVLTNKPDRFHSIKNIETFSYNKKIFTYFDKIIFPLEISERYKEGVLYIDSDLLCAVPKQFIQTFTHTNKFLYYKTWPNGDTFEDFKTNPYFRAFVEYLITENTHSFNHLLTILEWMYYFPYSEKTDNLLREAERIKCIFEYMSILTETGYEGIGNAEGLGLSYILRKHDVQIDLFKNLSLII